MVVRLRLIVAAWLVGACTARGPAPPANIELIDDGGGSVRLRSPAVRVVSLIPAATELVFALGAGDRLVGRTKWCDYPAGVQRVTSVGDGLSPNVEAILAERPDLVLAYRSPSNAAAVERLRSLNIAVLELAIDRVEDFERDARLVSAALGIAATGDSLAKAVRADLEAATTVDSSGPTVLIVAWSDPPMTLGSGSFLSDIVERAGGRNLFADEARASFVMSLEAVVARNPDLILVTGLDQPAFANRREWQAVSAVRERRYVRIDGSLFNRPSPRIGAAVRSLRRALGELR